MGVNAKKNITVLLQFKSWPLALLTPALYERKSRYFSQSITKSYFVHACSLLCLVYTRIPHVAASHPKRSNGVLLYVHVIIILNRVLVCFFVLAKKLCFIDSPWINNRNNTSRTLRTPGL